MSSVSDVKRTETWRRVRECAFGLCALWLVVQNAVLVSVVWAGGLLQPEHAAVPLLAFAFAVLGSGSLLVAGALLLPRLARGTSPASGHGPAESEDA